MRASRRNELAARLREERVLESNMLERILGGPGPRPDMIGRSVPLPGDTNDPERAYRARDRLVHLAITRSAERLGPEADDDALLAEAIRLVSGTPGVDRPVVVDVTWMTFYLYSRWLLAAFPNTFFWVRARRLVSGDRVTVIGSGIG